MSALVRTLALSVLALALGSCWLTASFGDLSDGGASDAAVDRGPQRDSGHDARRDARTDAEPDQVAPEDARDAGDAGDAADSLDAAPEGALDATCVTAKTYEESVLAEGPLAYWRLDEASGATAHDKSGHGYDGTYTSTGVTYGQPGAIAGDKDTSVLLDGTSGAVLVNNATFTTASQFDGNLPYSVEAWIQPQVINSEYRGILSNELQADAGKEGWVLYDQDTIGIGFDRYQVGTSTPLTKLGVVSAGSTWYHVVGVYDPSVGTMTIYVNGASVASASTTLTIVGGCTFAIGASHCGTTGFFDGPMDEVAVYSHAVDAACIMRHYKLGSGT